MCSSCSTRSTLARRDFLRMTGIAAVPLLTMRPRIARATAPRQVDVICKTSWGARPSQAPFIRHNIERITLHHSGVLLERNRQAPAALRSAQAYHQGHGWPDIAYHLMVDRGGNIYKGRPTWARGDSSTDYALRGHLLVMCVGNFDEQEPSPAQLRGLFDVLAWSTYAFAVPMRRISTHRQHVETACPGEALHRWFRNGDFRDEIRQRLNSGGVSLRRLCGSAGRARVQEIENGTGSR